MWIFVVLIISGVSARNIGFLKIGNIISLDEDTFAEEKEIPCPSNMYFSPSWNDCECEHGTVYYPPMDSCFRPFQQGPCKPEHYLAFRKNADAADCIFNICGNNGTLPYNHSCYFLETTGPCEATDVLRVNMDTLEIECTDYYYESYETSLFSVPITNVTECEAGKKRTANGKCRIEV